MRKMYEVERMLGSVATEEVRIDSSSRHEMAAILRALQHIYRHLELLEKILGLIKIDVLNGRREDRGALGLTCWEILVLAAVRYGCALDYDSLRDLANNHSTLRQIMGIGPLEESKRYKYRRIHANMSKIRVSTIRQIFEMIVKEGHTLAPRAIEAVRCDTFVVETNIHYPSDESLIVDGVRKLCLLGNGLSQETGRKGWRQYKHWHGKAKKIARRIQKTRRGRARGREEAQERLYGELLDVAAVVMIRAKELVGASSGGDAVMQCRIMELSHYIDLTARVCVLAGRRVINHERIPNAEKIFSIFETHTELIMRGKIPDMPEFGRRVFSAEDRVGLVVDFAVLDKGVTDEKLPVQRLRALQERMEGKIKSASFDRGFWTPENLKELELIVKNACLPKKGRHSQEDQARESGAAFVKTRLWHPGIESGIHALMTTSGLNVCPDRGSEGYNRYVAMGMPGKNLKVLGCILLKRDRKRLQKLEKLKKAS